MFSFLISSYFNIVVSSFSNHVFRISFLFLSNCSYSVPVLLCFLTKFGSLFFLRRLCFFSSVALSLFYVSFSSRLFLFLRNVTSSRRIITLIHRRKNVGSSSRPLKILLISLTCRVHSKPATDNRRSTAVSSNRARVSRIRS